MKIYDLTTTLCGVLDIQDHMERHPDDFSSEEHEAIEEVINLLIEGVTIEKDKYGNVEQ